MKSFILKLSILIGSMILSMVTSAIANPDGSLGVVFLMDSSGSVEQTGWNNEVAFVNSLVIDERLDNAYIGIVQFSSDNIVTKEVYFTSDQSRDAITSEISSLVWTKGATAIRTALENGTDIFAWATSTNDNNIIVLITDGNPNPANVQNPCDTDYGLLDDLEELAISVVVLGVGDVWNPDIISCLNKRGNDVILASDFSPGSMASIKSILFQRILDWDADTVLDNDDNCKTISNTDQSDIDNDLIGDACDDDIDGDGILNADDAFPEDKDKSELDAASSPKTPKGIGSTSYSLFLFMIGIIGLRRMRSTPHKC